MLTELTPNDIIPASFGLYFKYPNIIESSKEKDEKKRFLIKKYDEYGFFIGCFCYTSDEVFRAKEILPYTLKFNPEKLM